MANVSAPKVDRIHMNNNFKINISGRDLIIKTSGFAEQSNGSILLQYGETSLLATAVMSKREKEQAGFFPLTVNYEEKFYAAGKIGGSRYRRREGRSSDEATCHARLIDRAIRPLFPKELKREVQVVITILSWDKENEASTLGLLASSLALLISDIPWTKPIAAVRVGRVEDKFILNPTYEELEKSNIDVVFGAIEKDGILLNMIEGSFQQVDEKLVSDAYDFSRPYLEALINFQKKIQKEVGKEKITLEPLKTNGELETAVRGLLKDRLEKSVYLEGKMERAAAIDELKKEVALFIEENYPEETNFTENFFEEEVNKIIHKNLLEKEQRPDGRKLDQVRKLNCELSLLPRVHGSSLFSRGLTKSLSIVTLGSPGDAQLSERMEGSGKKRFLHHYNFPPYSVGEVKPMRGPGRREIGHGMLAEKALIPVIPSFETFPYTIRIVSEILSSNGSSSMASASSSSLALMDAGVPIKAPVTGIALGLAIDNSGKYKILTDIQGPEDHYGDMDFKIAGTKNGITAIQLDVKINGISEAIFKETLEKGKKARLHILEKITQTIEKPRENLSPFAPRVLILQINPEKIGKVIGPGGKMINQIIDECNASIDVEDTGRIFVTAEKEDDAKKAATWIESLTREVMAGEVFDGKVKRILTFGAFVELLPGQEGLLHISKMSSRRINKVEDVLNIGDTVSVKVIAIDEQGRINLALNKELNSHDRRNSRDKQTEKRNRRF